MSIVARKFFIASLIYLILGLLVQTVAILDVWLGFNPLAYTTVAATEQLLLLGWLTQLGLAVVYDRWLPQSNVLDLTVFSLFNIGLPLSIIGQPGLALFGRRSFGAIAAFGALLQLFAGCLFVYCVWKMISKQ